MRTLLISVCCVFLISCAGDQPSTYNSSNAVNTATAANTTAANSSANREYPQETVDAFLESCEEAGSSGAFCTCVFQKVQAKYTFEQFSVIESKLMAGTPPEEFVEFTGKARAECTK